MMHEYHKIRVLLEISLIVCQVHPCLLCMILQILHCVLFYPIVTSEIILPFMCKIILHVNVIFVHYKFLSYYIIFGHHRSRETYSYHIFVVFEHYYRGRE